MRHRVAKQRLNEKPGHARMVRRNLVTSLLLYEAVRTTKNRARAVQPVIDRLVTIAKTKPPHVAIRAINRVVTDRNASRKIMEVYADRYAQRSSGLTRVVPAGARKGDGAPLVDLELLDRDLAAPTTESPSTKKSSASAKKTTTSRAPRAKKTTESNDDASVADASVAPADTASSDTSEDTAS